MIRGYFLLIFATHFIALTSAMSQECNNPEIQKNIDNLEKILIVNQKSIDQSKKSALKNQVN